MNPRDSEIKRDSGRRWLVAAEEGGSGVQGYLQLQR